MKGRRGASRYFENRPAFLLMLFRFENDRDTGDNIK